MHYSIMFYGGRLLSHLSADDDEITEFISLRSLNRHVALVMDSDRNGLDAAINGTKQRLVKEFDENGGFVWLTDGREIENYIEPDILQTSVKDLYREAYAKPAATGDFDHALHFYRYKKGTEGATELFNGADKIKVARKVCEKSNQPGDRLNLRKKINGLIEMIRRANDTGAA